MDLNSLQQLRTQIVHKAQDLALNGQVDTDDKVALLMNLVRTGSATEEVIRAAFQAIEELADDDTKLTSYLDLLFEVDQMIAKQPSSAKPTEATQEQPSQFTQPEQPAAGPAE